MNNAMYEHPATQANLATLRARGVTVLEPGTGALGSPGEFGIGRLPEPPELLAAVEGALHAGGDLDGLNVLVSAGGTREPIDAVRFIGNRSSGRMGFALAEEAKRRGANVTVVAANVSLPRMAGIDYIDVGTAAELADACAAHFDACDVLIMAAAVADYRPDDRARRQAQEGSDGCGTESVARPYYRRVVNAFRPPPSRPDARRVRRRARLRRARVRPRQIRTVRNWMP